MLRGVISMPSNIFATTGTSVSILFIDKTDTKKNVVLIDASSLGEKVKEGKTQKTVLSNNDQTQIINTFNDKVAVDDFAVVVSYQNIQAQNFSLSASQYFDIKIKHVNITQEEFKEKIQDSNKKLDSLFSQSRKLETEIKKKLDKLFL